MPILSKINSVDIAAVSEINKTRLNTVAEKFNIKNKFTSISEMIEKVDFDAAIISTPTNTHKDIAVELLNNKKHVLIEKPIALNYQEAKEIDDAAKKNKTIAMVGMNFRFRPDTMLLKSLINSGELGELFYIKCGWTRKQSSEQKWFNKKSLAGGGVLLDLGIVLLDTALWLLDFPKVKNVTAQNYFHAQQSIEDSSVGFIRFNNSSVINFEVSWSFHDEHDSFKLAAFGTEGTGQLNPLRAYKKVASSRVDYTASTNAQTKNLFKKSYENELKHFVGAINGSNQVISSSEEALSRMKLVESLYESAKSKSEVSV
ncbi:MAG: Gfo/Idh/MocA family oxidoreductase [Ignavibacteriales bacterium]|nr:Gfo/Idh/MocA family oxidoreductase [Ignavibacteriales bacterium]MCB9210801.1 Gfo/Idh/MocA family oxidoreductase [Ignavibacteriales bacterium]MCB9217903.1 Gfo/Idh/MocA family oxidoreductase [Ignavibacteriales bacterium]